MPKVASRRVRSIPKVPNRNWVRRRRMPIASARPRPAARLSMPPKPCALPPAEARLEAEPCCVRMLNATVLLVEQPVATIAAGLKEQEELAGRPEQLIDIVPE